MKPRDGTAFRGASLMVWICLLGGLLQAYLAFYPDPLLIVWPDSFGFVGPGIDAVERGTFSFWGSSGSFLYQLLLWGLLSISLDPLLIVIVQRLMVIGTYCCLAIAAWLVMRNVSGRVSIPSWLSVPVVTTWLLSFVLYPGPVGTAHTLMTETLFSFLLACLLLCLTLIIVVDLAPRSRVGVASVFAVLDVALFFTRSHWLLAAFVSPIALLLVSPRQGRRQLVRGIVVGLVIATTILVIPNIFWERRDPGRLRVVFGPRSLFCNNADLIYDYLSSHQQVGFSETVRQSLGRMLTPEALYEARQHGWTHLGFDGDICTYGETTTIVSSHYTGQPSEEASFYLGTYASAALSRPSYVLSRVRRQMSEIDPFPAVMAESFQGDLKWAPSVRGLRKVFAMWESTYPSMFVGQINPPTMRSSRLRHLLVVEGGIAVGASVLGAVLVLIGRRSWGTWAGYERCFAAAAVCSLALNLLISVVHLIGGRYLIMQTPLFVFMGLTGSLTVLARLLLWVAPRAAPE